MSDFSQHTLFDKFIPVQGLFMCEVFGGKGSMTLAAMLHEVPAVAPWDFDTSKRMNVRKNGFLLFLFCAVGRMM